MKSIWQLGSPELADGMFSSLFVLDDWSGERHWPGWLLTERAAQWARDDTVTTRRVTALRRSHCRVSRRSRHNRHGQRAPSPPARRRSTAAAPPWRHSPPPWRHFPSRGAGAGCGSCRGWRWDCWRMAAEWRTERPLYMSPADTHASTVAAHSTLVSTRITFKL